MGWGANDYLSTDDHKNALTEYSCLSSAVQFAEEQKEGISHFLKF